MAFEAAVGKEKGFALGTPGSGGPIYRITE
jgi:hypothetical protein